MHRVLERQVKRYLGDTPLTPELKQLLEVISETYTHSDDDRALLDRSLELSSREFAENSTKLREIQEKTEALVLERTRELEHALSDVQIQKSRLEEAKAKDEAMLLSIGDGLIATDKDGNIIMVNKAFERMLGWTEAEVAGKKLTDIVLREDEAGTRVPPEERSISLVLKGEAPIGGSLKDIYYVRKDGTRFAAAGSTTPILKEGVIIGGVEVFRDVTQEKALDRAKNEFISLASHQLRTPLSSMKWTMELFTKNPGTLTPKQQEYLHDLETSNERLILLVNSLLNVARMETGKLIAAKKPAMVTDLIAASCKMIQPSADKKKQTIAQALDPGIKETDLDAMLFTESFNNLVSNAVNYAPEGATINVAVKPEGKYYVISVHNPGSVISHEDGKRLFTKFYRGDKARSIVLTGTGLGLYIAKSAVEENGGKIWYESSETDGTTFYFTVPMR